jgi:hypothetical protein
MAVRFLENFPVGHALKVGLEQLRLSGTKHQIIAVACSINHGERIRSLYEERGTAGFSASLIVAPKAKPVERHARKREFVE